MADLSRVDALVAGLGTGGTLMGTAARVRETNPDVVVVAAEPHPGDLVMGLRFCSRIGYVPPILDVSKLDRKLLVSNAEAVAAVRALLDREGNFAGVSSGAVVHVGAAGRGRGAAGRLDRRLRTRRCRLEVPLGRVLAGAQRREVDGGLALVVVPAAIRSELRVHAQEEAPNECCGILLFRDGVAERYVRGRNKLARRTATSSLEVEPGRLVRRGRGLRVSLGGLPQPSRDRTAAVAHRPRAVAGLWAGKAFLIYGLRLDELRGWRIARDEVTEIPLS